MSKNAASGTGVPLVLASGSPYRRALLARLGLPVDWVAPNVDERPLAGEAPAALAARLAAAKAAAVAAQRPDAIIIGSDQVADLDGTILGKPGSHEAAAAQLARCSGRSVRFLTAVVVSAPGGRPSLEHTDVTTVRFRTLDPGTIERYLAHDRPYDCAGSFKVESAGVALFERIQNEDPTALTGLPLIRVCAALAELGHPVF